MDSELIKDSDLVNASNLPSKSISSPKEEYPLHLSKPRTNYAGMLKISLIDDMLKQFDVSR